MSKVLHLLYILISYIGKTKKELVENSLISKLAEPFIHDSFVKGKRMTVARKRLLKKNKGTMKYRLF